MPLHGIRPRLLLAIAAVLVAVPIAMSSASRPTTARPPSTPSQVPENAFRPVTVSDRDAAPPSVAVNEEAREPDEGSAEAIGADSPEATPEPRPAATPPAGPVHVVRRDDNLWQIAAWHRVDLKAITRWNPDADPRRLVAGQGILVPGGASMPETAVPSASQPASQPVPRPAFGTNATSPSSHLWPLPVKGMITRRFSAAHPGIDIAAPAGTPVRAIAGGTVTWAGWRTNGGGYVVEIGHPNGMISEYNHNLEVVVSIDQVVAAGELIARVGATGWATGPHLDLRIEMGGRLVNPLGLY